MPVTEQLVAELSAIYQEQADKKKTVVFKDPITEEEKFQHFEENKNENDDEVDKVSELSKE